MSRLATLLTAAALSPTVAGAVEDSYGKYEMPAYEVVQTLNEVEIRQYAPHLLAEVAVRGERRAALNQGFRILAGYIFGGNTARQSIEMTAPVAQSQKIAMTVPVTQSADNGIWTVTFTMPRAWTAETLPVPNSDAVRFREVPGHRMAAIKFSGRATDRALAEAEATLRRTLGDAGIETVGPAQYQFYDDPMTLPWNRRNEVVLPLSN